MTLASDASTTLSTQILLLRCSLGLTLTAWQTIATAKWSRDATAARKNAINCRKASSNSRDETLSRWIMLKRLKSGINKQNAEGGAKGTKRRRQYRRTRARAAARIELKNGRTTERRRRTNGKGESRRNGRVLLGVERGE